MCCDIVCDFFSFIVDGCGVIVLDDLYLIGGRYGCINVSIKVFG